MPHQQLSLAPNEPARLRLEWGGYYRQFKVLLDGELVGEIEGGQKALKEGHDFQLPDGSNIHVRLHQTQLIDELQVLKDGKPLPGSASDPLNKVRAAILTGSLWGFLDLALGVIAIITSSVFMQRAGFGWHSLAFGIVLLVVTYFMGGGLRWAFLVGIVVFLADSLTGFLLASQAGLRPSSAAILARVLFLAPLVRGVTALGVVTNRNA